MTEIRTLYSAIKPYFDASRRRQLAALVVARIDRRRFIRWFLGLTLPFVFAVSLLIGWRNESVPHPGIVEYTIRSALLIGGFAAILAVLYTKFIGPAISALKASDLSKGPSAKRGPNA